MYDELIKKLRETPSITVDAKLHNEAADAIENVSKAYRMMAEAYEAEVTNSRWIPVTERLPEKDGKYLTVHTLNIIPPQPWIEVCWFAKDLYKVDKYDFHDKKKKSGFYQYDSEWGNFERTGISHWMPLPEPPKEE